MTIQKLPLATTVTHAGITTGSVLVAFHQAWPALQRWLENGQAQLQALHLWNYLLILVAVILEGPLATLLGGVWASLGRVNLLAVLAVAVLGGMLADSFWYFLGYFGREQVVTRWGRYLKIDAQAIGKMEAVLSGERASRILFTAKMTNALVIPAIVAAGIIRMGWRNTIRILLPAQLLWSVGLTIAGYLMADSVQRLNRLLGEGEWILTLILGGAVLGYGIYRWCKSGHTFEWNR